MPRASRSHALDDADVCSLSAVHRDDAQACGSGEALKVGGCALLTADVQHAQVGLGGQMAGRVRHDLLGDEDAAVRVQGVGQVAQHHRVVRVAIVVQAAPDVVDVGSCDAGE